MSGNRSRGKKRKQHDSYPYLRMQVRRIWQTFHLNWGKGKWNQLLPQNREKKGFARTVNYTTCLHKKEVSRIRRTNFLQHPKEKAHIVHFAIGPEKGTGKLLS